MITRLLSLCCGCALAVAPTALAGDPLGYSGGFGYVGHDAPYALRDIRATGTVLPLNDDQSIQIPIGFGFEFYGTTFGSVYVCSNGFLSFTDSYYYVDIEPLPGDGPANVIAAAWSDLDPPEGGDVIYQVLGPPGSRELVVGYYDVPHYPGWPATTAMSTFEIILHEGSNRIELQYETLMRPADHAGGTREVSIGIQNGTRTNGVQIAWFDAPTSVDAVELDAQGYTIAPRCPADVSGPEPRPDGHVDHHDVAAIVDQWGNPGQCAMSAGGLPTAIGPDGYGHTVAEIPVNIRDASSSYNGVLPPEDNISELFPIPFRFRFCGHLFDEVNVSSNGFISFASDDAGCCSGQPLPGNGPANMIAAAWNDLDLRRGGWVFYVTRGAPGSREFIVGYYDVQHHHDDLPPSNPPTVSTFEIILHEATGAIELQYDTLTQSADAHGGSEPGLPISIGIQDGARTGGLQIAYFDDPQPVDVVVLSRQGFMIRPPCGGDVTGPDDHPDGVVDALDFLRVLAEWSSPCTPTP